MSFKSIVELLLPAERLPVVSPQVVPVRCILTATPESRRLRVFVSLRCAVFRGNFRSCDSESCPLDCYLWLAHRSRTPAVTKKASALVRTLGDARGERLAAAASMPPGAGVVAGRLVVAEGIAARAELTICRSPTQS
jgi:hypothetical protein